MSFENIEIETIGRVGVIRMNRPKALNALSRGLAQDIADAGTEFDKSPDIGCILITGNGRAFAAGADIAEMAEFSAAEMSAANQFYEPWETPAKWETPVIAAVNGFALGGGCELALMCDIIIASSKAKFGQPEITLGVIPGIGGSQRLARFVGKPMTMDLCLTGRMIDAEEALRIGLVSRVYEADSFMEEALELAAEIAGRSAVANAAMTSAIDGAFETGLAGAIEQERRLFYELFDTNDQKEGMRAFLQKRTPNWSHS